MIEFIKAMWNPHAIKPQNVVKNRIVSNIVDISDEILDLKCRLNAIQHECNKYGIGKDVMYEVNFSIIDMSDLQVKLLSIARGIGRNSVDVQPNNSQNS